MDKNNCDMIGLTVLMSEVCADASGSVYVFVCVYVADLALALLVGCHTVRL